MAWYVNEGGRTFTIPLFFTILFLAVIPFNSFYYHLLRGIVCMQFCSICFMHYLSINGPNDLPSPFCFVHHILNISHCWSSKYRPSGNATFLHNKYVCACLHSRATAAQKKRPTTAKSTQNY